MRILTFLPDSRTKNRHLPLAVIRLSLLTVIALGIFTAHHIAAGQAAKSAVARQLAAEQGSRIEQLIARAKNLPGIMLGVAVQAYSPGALVAGMRELLALDHLAASVRLEPAGAEPVVVTRDSGAWSGRLPQLEAGSSQTVGSPIVSLEGSQLLVTQAVLSGDGERRRFWGHVSARIPLRDLAQDLRLQALETEGFAANLVLTADRTATPLALFGRVADDADDAVSRSVPLPQGGSLRITISPDGGIPAGLGVVLAGLAATAALLLAALRLARPPTPGAERPEPASAHLARETSARLLAEEHLERSHAMLDSMLEHFPGMVIIKRAEDLRIMRISQSAEQILGRGRDTLLGRSSDELYAPDFAERMHATDRQALAGGAVVELPLEQLTMPGQAPRWIRYRKLALRDRSGAPRYVLEFGEDQTERERLYHAMQEQVHFVEQLLDAIPGPLFYKDAEGRYLGVNAAFERFYGQPRSALTGRTVFDIAPPDLAAVYDAADRALLADGTAQIYESTVRRADGTTAEVIFHKAVFRSTNGEKGGIVGVALDISARKEAERRVSQLNRILTVLGETSQLIIQIHDRDELLRRVGALLRERGNFPVAWIALDGAAAPMVFAAADVADTVRRLLDGIAGTAPPEPAGDRRHCRRIDAGDGAVAAELAAMGLNSLVRLPLAYQGAVRGSIGLLGAETELFDQDADRLLAELAGNLSRALDGLDQEAARRSAEQKLQLAGQVFENNAEGIIVTDAANRIVMVNKAFTQLTGYRADEVLGRNPSLLNSGRQDAQFYRNLWASLHLKGEWRGEIINRRKNGEYYPEFLTISVVRDDAGDVTHYVAVFADLTARKQVEERLEFLAHYDALTALPNRILFTDRLNRALVQAGRAEQRVALYFLDLDRFSLVNDTFGHAGGDRLLQEVSLRLQAVVNERGSVSRLGGDEFAIYAEGLLEPADAAAFARRIQEALKAPLKWDGQEIHMSASIGVGIFPDDGADAEELAKNADSAMYQAIADGGNAIRFFHLEMNEHSYQRIQLEGKLHHALDRGEFSVFFQPFIAAATGRVVGAEALLRWMHPDFGGFASPTTFIPLLEETGLIAPVGEWVLRRAIEEAVKWREIAGEDLLVAVNLSAVQLADDGLPRQIGQLLAESGLPPASLEIELTESAVIRDASRGIGLLRELRALGIQLSVDDFGTGYSSLSYLKQLPITTLKIDRSFVMDIPEDDQAITIARAIIAMGHSLGLHIIAEGVESPAQALILREAGTDFVQGFYFARPMAAEDFRQVIRKQAESTTDALPRQLHLATA